MCSGRIWLENWFVFCNKPKKSAEVADAPESSAEIQNVRKGASILMKYVCDVRMPSAGTGLCALLLLFPFVQKMNYKTFRVF
ncbi:MAG: hypothetical protein II180_08805, partial [Proteobacteria bacterium]|nr:hypothetical protein [Pseudomonadota bacterium]